MDNDCYVFHLDMLDDEFAQAFDPVYPWLVESNEGVIALFTDEEHANMFQREYRRTQGLDPMTGYPLTVTA